MSQTISCGSCGAEIEVKNNDNSVKCDFCGNKTNIEKSMAKVVGSKKHKMLLNSVESENWEDVNKYSSSLLDDDPDDFIAWFYKGAAAGWNSRHIDDPSKEIMNCFRNAFTNSTDENLSEVLNLLGIQGGQLLHSLALGSRQFAQEHGYLDVGDMLHNSWQEEVMNGHINKIIGYIDIAYMLTEINRNERVENLDPKIDANFITLYKFLYTSIPFEGKFSKKNPFNITDATFMYIFDHESDLGIKWSTRADLIENMSKQGSYNKDLIEYYELTDNDFIKVKTAIEEKDDGCFIATVCLDNEDDELLQRLRIFRDTNLKTNFLGQKFVQLYYKFGPRFAHYISRKDRLKSITRYTLIYPLEFVLRTFNLTEKR